ncbi:MAG: DUF805 domain-containing protein [Sphingopyxis sp.]
MEWMLMGWKKYADFSGRARRKEFWMFFLGYLIAYLGLALVDRFVGTNGILAGLFGLAALVPSIAVACRRMHDVDKSGWFQLIPIYSLILECTEGTSGPNQYGPDPKGSDAATFS